MFTRRQILLGSACAAALAATGVGVLQLRDGEATAKGRFAVTKTPEQWREILTPEQFAILRDADTERPWTSSHNKEKREGIFACAACDLPLFESETKFESGTGWPSFYKPIEGAIGMERDFSWGMLRDEVHCSRCCGHLGYVFNDGPKPTGKRYRAGPGNLHRTISGVSA